MSTIIYTDILAMEYLFMTCFDYNTQTMDIKPDLPFLNIHNLFPNERISVYLDKHNRVFLNQMITFLNKQATLLRAWLQKHQRNVNYNNELLWLLTERLGTVILKINVYVVYFWKNIKLMKGIALRKHSLHEKTAASVLLKLLISQNE